MKIKLLLIGILWILGEQRTYGAENNLLKPKETLEKQASDVIKQDETLEKQASDVMKQDEAQEEQANDIMKQDEVLEEQVQEYMDLDAIDRALDDFAEVDHFSFTETVKKLLTGEIPLEADELLAVLMDLFCSELKQQKSMAVQILMVVLASAVFTSFVKVFENCQIADISFYMLYLLIATMLVKSFGSMNSMVLAACRDLSDFMKLLLPSYLVTVVLSAGSVSALGFYEVTVLAMNLLQIFIIKIILPSINFYLVLLILNQLAKEDYFSKMAHLAELIIGWLLKTILGLVLGIQAVQCLVTPAVDSLKGSAMHRLAKSIPGLGSALDLAAETVAGSAVVIKNAVGVAGILALAVICLPPVLKLAASILMFRLLCAMIQPFCEKRMVEGIESISQGTALLLRVQLTSVSIFMISLAMITAAVRG